MTSPLRTRLTAAGLAAASLATLAGCAATSAGTTIDDTTTSGSNASSGTYSDGTYTASAGYQAPSGTESITVELTVADGTVTAVNVSQQATDREAQEFQARFASGVSSAVVGKELSGLSVSRVSGSSLTSNGFNAALEDIRAQAA